MGSARTRCRYAQTLFNLGSLGGLSDGELLALFATRSDEAGELAFAVLVERHGPMVLRVCRSILRDEHDAQDAVQATFLVLVRRGGAIRNRGSIGSWLHGVPVGTIKSRLARGRARLRGQLIRRGFAPSACAAGPAEWPDAAPARLPVRVPESIARTAVGFAAGDEASLGAVSAWIAAVTSRVLFAMSLRRLARAAAVVLMLTAASIGVTAFAQKTSADRSKPQAAGKKGTKRDALPPRVPPELVVERALAAADQITVPWMKAYALADIAAIQAKLGQAEPAQATFREAAEIINGNRDNASLHTTQLAWLAKAQAKAADRAGARAKIARIIELAGQPENARDRGMVLDAAARWQIDGGNAEGALALVEARKDAPLSWRAYILSGIGAVQAGAGDLAGARATMARALADAERAEKEPAAIDQEAIRELDPMRLAQVRGMAPFARAEAKAGDIEGARTTLGRARAIADRVRNEWRPAPLSEIAMAHRAAGDAKAADEALAAARAIAMGLPEPGERIDQLARVAIIQAEAGDRKAGRETYDQALWIAAQNPPAPGSLVYQCFSGAKARVGDWVGAREFALGQTDSALRATHVEGLCFQQAKAGERSDALVWALGQTDPINRAHALLGVVRGMIELRPRQ
jgi:Sigma-70 region 2